MNNSIIAWKARAQLDDFMVKVFHGFSKPLNKFIRDMMYGIQATGDTILTDIARVVDSEGKHRNVENRLSRNLQAEGLAQGLQDAVMDDVKRFIDRNTLVLVTAYFAAAWLGRGVRKDVLVAHIERMHQRFNDVPEFFLYALADGIRRAFSRHGTWKTKAATRPKPPDDGQPDLPGWDELAFLDAG